MKKYVIAASLLMALSASAQKDELKALRKLDDKEKPAPGDSAEYKRLLGEVEAKLGAATDEQKIEYYYYKGSYAGEQMMVNAANPAKAQASFQELMDSFDKVLEMEKARGKKKYTQEIEVGYAQLKDEAMLPAARAASQQKNYKVASGLFYAAYKLDKKDPSNLYNAAAMAVNGQDYDKALEYYLELDKIGYTGEGTVYSAKNVKTGQREYFPNTKVRELSIAQKQHTDPKDEVLPSLKGDIVKNIALIYIHKGDVEKAKQAMVAARKAYPNDVSLIISEADLYLKTKDMDMYRKLITEATQKNPNNADLFYNLGVISTETDRAEAVKNYEKALAINPNHVNANINMGTVIMFDEEKIVKEMNTLGTSAKDNKRYDELKKQRNDMYRKALPYFEKAVKADPENQYAITMAANLYQALEMTAEAKAMKAKLKG